MTELRREELATNLAAVHRRIDQACADADRDPGEVTLVVVTKFFPARDVRLLHELGVRDVGESRHQEAEAKVADCADLDLTWHFVGRLQSNKAALVAAYADVVASVDRAKLVPRLSQGAHQGSRPVDCLIQVSLDEPPARDRGGADPAELPALATAVDGAAGLRLRGIMAVAPLGAPPAPAFARLRELSGSLRAEHASADWISAGMSGDLEDAVRAGATHVRIGSAVLGPRPANR